MKIFDVIVRIVSVLLLATSVSSAQDFQLLEATISSAQASMTSGEITCRELVELYLDRIEAYDKQGPELNAIQHINPRVLEEADELDPSDWGKVTSRPEEIDRDSVMDSTGDDA